MNLLDVVIVLASVGAAVGGYRLGFLTRAAAWTGMCVGGFIAIRIAPTFTGRFRDIDPNRSLLIAAVTLLAGAFVGQLVGQSLGHQLRRRAAVGRGAKLDKAVGAASGVFLVLAAVWLLTPTMAAVPSWPAQIVDGSLLANQIDKLTPEPPDALATASKLVGAAQWDELSAQFASGLPTGPVPALDGPVPAVDAAARAATVLVEHAVCDRGAQEGTGFVADRNLVVTNAHVVAGAGDAAVRVQDGEGRWHVARVVLFDPEEDLAVLRVESLAAAPLALADNAVAGTTGFVYGHPGGLELRIRPFRAGTEANAEVSDIYGERDVVRRIVPIRAKLAKGDSGSPLIDEGGRVVGVAFAISPDDEALAVAIAVNTVRDAVEEAGQRGADAPEESTGRCLPTQ